MGLLNLVLNNMRRNAIQSPWFTQYGQSKSAEMRLFTFPFSGAGSVIYQPWVKYFNDTTIEVVGAQLPGREARLSEPLSVNLQVLIQQLTEAITPYTDKPYSFFGHSLGGLVAFELCRSLRKRGMNLPENLFVSAFRAPDMINPNPILHKLTDSDLIDKVKAYGGTVDAILSSPDLMAMLLPIIRADFTIFENYIYQADLPLDLAIIALSGKLDRVVRSPYMTNWQQQTSQRFDHFLYDGDHFFLNSHREEIVMMIKGKLLKNLNHD